MLDMYVMDAIANIYIKTSNYLDPGIPLYITETLYTGMADLNKRGVDEAQGNTSIDES